MLAKPLLLCFFKSFSCFCFNHCLLPFTSVCGFMDGGLMKVTKTSFNYFSTCKQLQIITRMTRSPTTECGTKKDTYKGQCRTHHSCYVIVLYRLQILHYINHSPVSACVFKFFTNDSNLKKIFCQFLNYYFRQKAALPFFYIFISLAQ